MKIKLTQRLNKMFEQYSNIQLDCYGITYLINEYINQVLIYQNNSDENRVKKNSTLIP